MVTQQIKHCPSKLSVVNRVASESESPDAPVAQNDPSLPICNIVFMVHRHSARSQTTSGAAHLCGEVVLIEVGSSSSPMDTILEFDQPLTENTQSVSVSFTSTRLLCTMMTRGVFYDPSFDRSVTVGRVVRVLPVLPMDGRKTTSLRVDVLLVIFKNLRSPPSDRSWRKDVLSCALVCRKWTCALSAAVGRFPLRRQPMGISSRNFHLCAWTCSAA